MQLIYTKQPNLIPDTYYQETVPEKNNDLP
jgi:hypothetical protein